MRKRRDGGTSFNHVLMATELKEISRRLGVLRLGFKISVLKLKKQEPRRVELTGLRRLGSGMRFCFQ